MQNKNLHIIEFKLKKLLNWGLFGNYKSKISGAWMEFDEHRNYNPGDNVRDIDWKASSKTGELYVKKYEQEKDLKVLFVLDTSETMYFGSENKTKTETLTETFYALALSAYYNNDSVWAIIWNDLSLEFLDYKKSKNNIYRILEKININSGHPQGVPLQKNKCRDIPCGYPTENSLNEIKLRKIKNNLIFILTDKTDFDLNKLKFLNRDNDIIIINIFDKFENSLSTEGFTPLLSLNLENKFLNIDLWDTKKIEEFKRLIEKKIEKLKFDLEKNNIWYIFLDNKTDILKELIKYFK